MFHDGNRLLQDRFDTRRLADRIEDRLVSATINADQRAFIEAQDLFFLATVDDEGRPTCSYKGGEPGFVRVLDEQTLAFPSYDGNGMFLSLGNVLRRGDVGILFIDLQRPARLRVQGIASVDLDDPLKSSWPQAQLVVRVRVEQVFPNCSRYIHRYQLVQRSAYLPHAGVTPPVPDWKRADWAVDVLPKTHPE